MSQHTKLNLPLILTIIINIYVNPSHAYSVIPSKASTALDPITTTTTSAAATPSQPSQNHTSRRSILLTTTTLPLLLLSNTPPSHAAFTPGGSIVDEVGVTVGNPSASLSRRVDNSNVLFGQDYYFKFGTAPQWIEPGSVDYPKTMPFVLTQQRYDNLKKYQTRVQEGANYLSSLLQTTPTPTLPPPSDPIYALRPFGLLANGFMASENTGTTNELFLARWYINEAYLRIGDAVDAEDEKVRRECLGYAITAVNSFFAMINRQIGPKVGEKFRYL